MRFDIEAYVKAYNAGDFGEASRLVDPEMISDTCGSVENYISALDQNFAGEVWSMSW